MLGFPISFAISSNNNTQAFDSTVHMVLECLDMMLFCSWKYEHSNFFIFCFLSEMSISEWIEGCPQETYLQRWGYIMQHGTHRFCRAVWSLRQPLWAAEKTNLSTFNVPTVQRWRKKEISELGHCDNLWRAKIGNIRKHKMKDWFLLLSYIFLRLLSISDWTQSVDVHLYRKKEEGRTSRCCSRI